MQGALAQTAVIIPARNEAASIGKVLEDLPDARLIIVANNGSIDETPEIAKAHGCLVVDEPVAGYGRACLAGLAALESSEDHSEITIVAFADADYSDHVHQLKKLIEPIANDEADFVLGSRMMGEREPGAMPLQATLGNRLACFLMNLVWRTNYTDLGPFRAMNYEQFRALEMNDTNFGWTVEMQVKASIAGLRILELPVPYRRRIGVSKISGTISGTIRAGYKILFTIAKYAWLTRWGRRSSTR
ncbi:MAG: glycosyltransferase family 2 protein [Planctomycetota bacterium]